MYIYRYPITLHQIRYHIWYLMPYPMSHPMSYPIIKFFHDWSDPIFLGPSSSATARALQSSSISSPQDADGDAKEILRPEMRQVSPIKSVQLIFVYITLLPISAHHGNLPTMTYTKLSGESPVMAPILRTPLLRWRAQWWANWLDSKWVVRRLGTTNIWWLIMIDHNCPF